MEKGMAKRTGKADMAQDNASVKMPNSRFTQKTKRHGFYLHSYILKRKGKGRERKGWEGEKGNER